MFESLRLVRDTGGHGLECSVWQRQYIVPSGKALYPHCLVPQKGLKGLVTNTICDTNQETVFFVTSAHFLL